MRPPRIQPGLQQTRIRLEQPFQATHRRALAAARAVPPALAVAHDVRRLADAGVPGLREAVRAGEVAGVTVLAGRRAVFGVRARLRVRAAVDLQF